MLWENRADNVALHPCTDSASTAVNTENWPIEARKEIPHSHFTSSCSQPGFLRQGVSCDLFSGFVPPQKLANAEFCTWWRSHFLPVSISVRCLTSLITDTQN